VLPAEFLWPLALVCYQFDDVELIAETCPYVCDSWSLSFQSTRVHSTWDFLDDSELYKVIVYLVHLILIFNKLYLMFDNIQSVCCWFLLTGSVLFVC